MPSLLLVLDQSEMVDCALFSEQSAEHQQKSKRLLKLMPDTFLNE